MICPICQKGHMLQPAPDMLQCAGCGNGQTGRGFHYSWSLSSVEVIGETIAGVFILYDSLVDKYKIGSLCWDVDENGDPNPTTVSTEIIDTVESSEYSDFPLPVVWLGKPGKLKNKMYKTTLGRKEKK